MRILAYFLLMFALLVLPANAQVPGFSETEAAAPGSETSGLDALIDIIEADPAGAAMLERVRATAIAGQQEAKPVDTSDTTIACYSAPSCDPTDDWISRAYRAYEHSNPTPIHRQV